MSHTPTPTRPRSWRLLAVCAVLALAGCAGPYQTRLDFRAPPNLGVAEGTRLAAQAMQDIGFWPKFQNEGTGVVSGEKTEKITFGWETMTITLEVGLVHAAQGGLSADAKCSVSANMAYWDEGDECVAQFHKAFERRVAAWQPPQRVQPPPSGYRPAEPRPAPPPRGREFDL